MLVILPAVSCGPGPKPRNINERLFIALSKSWIRPSIKIKEGNSHCCSAETGCMNKEQGLRSVKGFLDVTCGVQ